jgi:hypothetical protein
VIFSLLGGVVLQILIGDGCVHFLRLIKDVRDIEFISHFPSVLLSIVNDYRTF